MAVASYFGIIYTAVSPKENSWPPIPLSKSSPPSCWSSYWQSSYCAAEAKRRTPLTTISKFAWNAVSALQVHIHGFLENGSRQFDSESLQAFQNQRVFA